MVTLTFFIYLDWRFYYLSYPLSELYLSLKEKIAGARGQCWLEFIKMWLLWVSVGLFFCGSLAYLYPVESESRQVKSLNGLWLFNFGDIGFSLKWYEADFNYIDDVTFMPVPSSYNEVDGTEDLLRDYLGWAWYQREFFLGRKWSASRIFVYFGAVDHHSIVWCNGIEVGRHSGGHIPFHLELTQAVEWEGRNTLTVAVNNTLTPHTLPQGYTLHPNDTSKYPSGTYLYSHNCDYFDYAGINRNVFLYSVPQVFIKDLDITADFYGENAVLQGCFLKYEVILENADENISANCSINLTGGRGDHILYSEGCKQTIAFTTFNIWTPEMARIVKVEVKMQYGTSVDIYRTTIGFRSIEWEGPEGLKISGSKFYPRGFGMHEDSDIRGRGYDDVLATRDISLLRWAKANTIRTSHYPYSEEFLRQCDVWGIAVILEVPACSIVGFDEELYQEHERLMLEIIASYKHHPSIIMWSLANEPATNDNASIAYFSRLYESAKAADPTRPITFVTSQPVNQEKAIGAMDVILVNRYSGWYQSGGRLDLIEYQIRQEVKAWRKKFNKPVIMSEYGAGSLPGQNTLVPSMWTEDYQITLLKKHFEIYDKLREEGLLSGEMIWNLIDFKTPQEYFRPGFCMKGIFTRQREPKAAAHLVRQRYSSIH